MLQRCPCSPYIVGSVAQQLKQKPTKIDDQGQQANAITLLVETGGVHHDGIGRLVAKILYEQNYRLPAPTVCSFSTIKSTQPRQQSPTHSDPVCVSREMNSRPTSTYLGARVGSGSLMVASTRFSSTPKGNPHRKSPNFYSISQTAYHITVQVQEQCLAPNLKRSVSTSTTKKADHAGGASSYSTYLDRLDVLLGTGVDHLNGHRLLPGNAWSNLGREHTKAVVDGPRLDQQSLRQTSDFSVEGGHQHRQRLGTQTAHGTRYRRRRHGDKRRDRVTKRKYRTATSDNRHMCVYEVI